MPLKRFEEVAHLLPRSKRASWILLTDMYDERADIHARLAEKMRRVQVHLKTTSVRFLFLFS
jgi:hypothetical protein